MEREGIRDDCLICFYFSFICLVAGSAFEDATTLVSNISKFTHKDHAVSLCTLLPTKGKSSSEMEHDKKCVSVILAKDQCQPTEFYDLLNVYSKPNGLKEIKQNVEELAASR
ncbi:hypothetical protein SSX86_005586 [Deinandra increscens subsp. villosa]|uniref:Uncharacterized protein n=1 Tax=Deinandra increscens subsp. villosa TaxID=3103831 RepID=A0AAP0H8N2_9ASTR